MELKSRKENGKNVHKRKEDLSNSTCHLHNSYSTCSDYRFVPPEQTSRLITIFHSRANSNLVVAQYDLHNDASIIKTMNSQTLVDKLYATVVDMDQSCVRAVLKTYRYLTINYTVATQAKMFTITIN